MHADPEDFESRARNAVSTHIMHFEVVVLLAEMAAEIRRLEKLAYA